MDKIEQLQELIDQSQSIVFSVELCLLFTESNIPDFRKVCMAYIVLSQVGIFLANNQFHTMFVRYPEEFFVISPKTSRMSRS